MPEDLLALLGGPGETSDQRLDGLEDRVGRFRRAERAVALGLAATAFEPVTV